MVDVNGDLGVSIDPVTIFVGPVEVGAVVERALPRKVRGFADINLLINEVRHRNRLARPSLTNLTVTAAVVRSALDRIEANRTAAGVDHHRGVEQKQDASNAPNRFEELNHRRHSPPHRPNLQ